MAQCTVRRLSELSGTLVLAPERYDPRRASFGPGGVSAASIPLGTVARVVNTTVSPFRKDVGSARYLVLDTSDASEGIVICRKTAVGQAGLGSVKKELRPADVIISRLRPYLRQVALVDRGIRGWEEHVRLVCSTEFFVLRSVSEASIAFLVPYLLSEPVQKVLSASQEGGHHPRFAEATLLNLMVPLALSKRRAELSAEVERSVGLFRESERLLVSTCWEAERSFNDSDALAPGNE